MPLGSLAHRVTRIRAVFLPTHLHRGTFYAVTALVQVVPPGNSYPTPAALSFWDPDALVLSWKTAYHQHEAIHASMLSASHSLQVRLRGCSGLVIFREA
jgi:hypothetical protein